MKKYFNVPLEFDRKKIEEIITIHLKNNQKGYICAIESNNLTVANNNETFHSVINSSLFNICDGSVIAFLLCKMHKKDFKPYTGSDFLIDHIKKKKYKHYFLGNTQNVLDGLKLNLQILDPEIESMDFVELPFLQLNEFDYPGIASHINKSAPDFIWISLGAPKQEFFMYNLLPFINKGIMVGIGAAFNFYSSQSSIKRAPRWMRQLKLEWLHRAMEEPRKNIPRYWNFIKILPALLTEESNKIKKTN